MEFDTGRVPDDLEASAAYHGDEEAPSPVADPEEDLCEEAKGEDGEVEGIAGERRHVMNLAKLLDRARRVGAEPRLVPESSIEPGRRARHFV